MPSFTPYSRQTSSQSGAAQSYFSQIRQSFGELGRTLDSGDLPGAHCAFSPLQLLTYSASPGKQTRFAADLAAVGKALQSGDLSAVRSAFDRLQQTRQAAGGAWPRQSSARI